MLIVCPSCATSYDVEAASLSPNGRQVRCLRCRTVWRAELNHADDLIAAAAALAPNAYDPLPGTVSRPVGDTANADMEPHDDTGALAAFHRVDPLERHFAAELEDAVEAPPIVPRGSDAFAAPVEIEHMAAGDQTSDAPGDIESAAERWEKANARRRLRWPLSGVHTAILFLALFVAGMFGWRSDVVRALPQTASFYALLGMPVNLRGLTFEDVTTSTEQAEGVPILVVEGNVFNSARKPEDVPRLKFVMRNAARQEIYSWIAVPARPSLSPGEVLAFRSQLAAPPSDAKDVIVRFVNRSDVVAKAR
jgi:predicted Zn finger-like uncharacterized protein